MSLWDSYLRWRHSKGFGVHSPFAYRFITDVVKPGKYGYYAYHNLDRLLLDYDISTHRNFKKIAFVIRILIFLKIKRVVSFPQNEMLPRLAAESLRLPHTFILKDSSFKFREGDILIIQSEFFDDEILREAINYKIPVFALTPGFKLRKELTKPLSRGVLFDWKDKILLIPRPEMAYISYLL